MAGNTLKLEFAGDADKLARASKKAEQSVAGVDDEVTKASADMANAAKDADTYTDRIGKLGAGVSGATDAIDSAGAAVQALADIQQQGAAKAARLARANNDVRQAQEDMNQAVRDGQQALIDAGQAEVDLEQARLDQKTALTAYNDAVKEFGANSDEARQAQIDLKQAGVDVKQAQEDAAQATRDGAQASIDAEAATLDLADAQKEAHPPDMQAWADQIGMITPILSGLVGIIGLVTAAQWAWNLAQLASPTTWIILAIVALVAVIVLIATKTQWFQKAWSASWSWIKKSAANVMDWIKKIPGWTESAFKKIAQIIVWPYKTAFNLIADAWNATIGSLSWTVPGWIPGIGGNTIAVPNIPHFHSGGVVPGAPGSVQIAALQAGERIESAVSASGAAAGGWIRLDAGAIGDAILKEVQAAVGRKGGRVTALGVQVVGGNIRT